MSRYRYGYIIKVRRRILDLKEDTVRYMAREMSVLQLNTYLDLHINRSVIVNITMPYILACVIFDFFFSRINHCILVCMFGKYGRVK